MPRYGHVPLATACSALVASLLLSACGQGGNRYDDYSDAENAEMADLEAPREPEPAPEPRDYGGSTEIDPDSPLAAWFNEEEAAPAPQPQLWTCRYSPTYNDDWHDDVLCTDGTDMDRPYLLEWDSFVTEDEIMQAAAEYEAELNAG